MLVFFFLFLYSKVLFTLQEFLWGKKSNGPVQPQYEPHQREQQLHGQSGYNSNGYNGTQNGYGGQQSHSVPVHSSHSAYGHHSGPRSNNGRGYNHPQNPGRHGYDRQANCDTSAVDGDISVDFGFSGTSP